MVFWEKLFEVFIRLYYRDFRIVEGEGRQVFKEEHDILRDIRVISLI